jgi:ADP-ribose pyrophosphatase YjhB (NUDIX family)
MNNKVMLASGPVIIENNKILLNKSGKDDFWKFCGGRLNPEDNLIDVAKFRVREEMGLEIEITNPEPFLMYTKKPNDPEIDVILVHFLAKRLNEIQPGEMVKEWDWFDIENLPENLAPNIQPTLKHFGFMQ